MSWTTWTVSCSCPACSLGPGRRRCASCAGAWRPDPLRIAFFGTPDAAVPSLDGLLAAGHDVALVVSRADTRRGRGGALSPSPVKAAALAAGLPVTDRPADAMGVGASLGVVVAYGRLIRPPLLGALPLLNVHFSLLPRWRGAAPVERAILAGDADTGVCLMALEAGLDTGPVYRRVSTPIGPEETAAELSDRLARLGRDLLLSALADGLGEPVAQSGEPVYAEKLGSADRQLVWSSPAAVLGRVVRVGRAWTTVGGRRLLVLSATPLPSGAAPTDLPPGALVGEGRVEVVTGDGRLRLHTVQPEGRGALAAADWARGARLPAGTVLGR